MNSSDLDRLQLFEKIAARDISGLQELIDRRINVNQFSEDGSSTPLIEATKQEWIDGICLLIQAGADVHLNSQSLEPTPLGIAVFLGNIELIELLLQANAHPDYDGDCIPLHQAIYMEREDIVKTLIEAGAGLNTQGDCWETPLMVAASTGNLSITRILVEASACINYFTDEFGNTALMVAADEGHQEIFDYLLPFTPEDQHAQARELLPAGLIRKQRRENKPLNRLIEVVKGGSLESVQEAIKAVVDINAFDERGKTALHAAIFSRNNPAIISALIKAGAHPNIQAEYDGHTPLMDAAWAGYTSMVDALINCGANPNQTVQEVTPLMMAAETNRLEVAKLLLDAGANINYKTSEGKSALFFAYQSRHSGMAQFLLDMGATNDLCPISVESDWF